MSSHVSHSRQSVYGWRVNELYVRHLPFQVRGSMCIGPVYIKPTNSDVSFNYNSKCPQRKNTQTFVHSYIAPIKSLLNGLFHNHITKLLQTFIKNSYPNHLFDRILQHYLIKNLDPSSPSIVQHPLEPAPLNPSPYRPPIP